MRNIGTSEKISVTFDTCMLGLSWVFSRGLSCSLQAYRSVFGGLSDGSETLGMCLAHVEEAVLPSSWDLGCAYMS